jgi:hypothetical protein
MATKKFAVGAILALVIGGAGVPLAFAGGDDDEGGNGHGDHARVLQLVLRHIQDTDVDLGASGPSVNDRFSVFGDVLQDGQKVGTGGYDCVTLNFQAGAGGAHRSVHGQLHAAARPDHGAGPCRPRRRHPTDRHCGDRRHGRVPHGARAAGDVRAHR